MHRPDATAARRRDSAGLRIDLERADIRSPQPFEIAENEPFASRQP